MGPLDKQVDIYCAWIDEADAINSKKRNEAIGLIDNDRDSDEDENYGTTTGKREPAQAV